MYLLSLIIFFFTLIFIFDKSFSKSGIQTTNTKLHKRSRSDISKNNLIIESEKLSWRQPSVTKKPPCDLPTFNFFPPGTSGYPGTTKVSLAV